TFSAGSSTGCSVNGNVVTLTNVNGTCSLTATKASDGYYSAFTSAPFPVTLTAHTLSTTITLSTSAARAAIGSPVTLTATVSPSSATGTITFLDLQFGAPLGTGTLSGGVATLTTSSLAVGQRSLVAIYGGDTNDFGSGSATLLQEVTGGAGSGLGFTTQTLTLTSDQNIAGYALVMVTGDFNGDGKPDLAVILNDSGSDQTNNPSNVEILLGNGTGGFTVGSTFA